MSSRLNWSGAVQAFCKHLLEPQCHHIHADLNNNSHCPDCGEQVSLQWVQLRCHGCNSKRVPQKDTLNQIKPLHRHCHHCGAAGYRQVTKSHIQSFELLHSIGVKSVVNPAELERININETNPIPRVHQFKKNHFRGQPYHVVEGQVVRKHVF